MLVKAAKFIFEGGKTLVGKLGKASKVIADVLISGKGVVKNLIEGGFVQTQEHLALKKAAKEFAESTGMSLAEIVEKGAIGDLKANPAAAEKLMGIIGEMLEKTEPAASRGIASRALALRSIAAGLEESHAVKQVGEAANAEVTEAINRAAAEPNASTWGRLGKVMAAVGAAGSIAYLIGDLAMEDTSDPGDIYWGNGSDEDSAAAGEGGGGSSYMQGKIMEELVEDVLAASAMRVRGLRALLNLLKNKNQTLLEQVLDEMSER
jgi:hypothetical protein